MLVISLICLSLAILFFWLDLTDHNMDGVGFVLGIVFTAISIASFFLYLVENKNEEFEKHHISEIVVPEIKLLDKNNERIIYLIDGEVKTFTDMKWLQQDNIRLEIKYYKDVTNVKYIVKEN